MIGWSKLSLTRCGLALAGCVSSEPTTKMAVGQGATPQAQIVSAAGLNVASVTQARSDAGFGAARDVGLTAAAAAGGGGWTRSQGLAGGVIGILAAPPRGMEAVSHMITMLPSGADPAVEAARIQRVAYAVNPAPADYISVPIPELPGQTTRFQPGCPKTRAGYKASCSRGLSVQLVRAGTFGTQTVYRVAIASKTGVPDAVIRPRDYLSWLKRIADRAGPNVSVYAAPHRAEGGWSQPVLYRSGQNLPL